MFPMTSTGNDEKVRNAMACSVPICYLLHREAPDGTESLLMEPDLASALVDAVSDPAWRAVRITFGRQIVLEGADLETAIAESLAA